MPMFREIEINQKNTPKIKFGEHLIFDAYGCNPKKLNDMEFLHNLLYRIAEKADMHVLAPAYLVKADGNETLGGKDPGGYSGFLLIMESHISIHTFVKRGYVTIDLYSCKPFNSEGIVEFLEYELDAKDYSVFKMDRGLKYPAENIYE